MKVLVAEAQSDELQFQLFVDVIFRCTICRLCLYEGTPQVPAVQLQFIYFFLQHRLQGE